MSTCNMFLCCGYLLGEAILMSTHNICLYEEMWKIIPKLSSDEPRHDKTNKMSVHQASLIRVFAVCSDGS